MDDFSDEAYRAMVRAKAEVKVPRISAKTACIHSLVSQNRLRFTNQEFNLDLAYISKRVIAMGYPA